MTNFSLVRGRAMRATRTSACGEPVTGPDSTIVTDGFVSAALTANLDTGEAITVTNAAGRQCVNDQPDSRFLNYGVAITFCGVNPELVSMMSGQKLVYDAEGNPVGLRQNSRLALVGSFALEVWAGVPGQVCGDDGNESFGYSLLPFIKGGTLGDFSFENAAVTFTLTNATTRDGNGWGAGPYDVVRDENGAPSPLLEVLDKDDHLHLQLTTLAPPTIDAEGDSQALGVPATGGVAATGASTPANSYFPKDLAELQAGVSGDHGVAVVASPTTAWTTGQSITLRDGSEANWNGTAWEAGVA